MIHREAWYREILSFLGLQDSDSWDEDSWAHPDLPGKFPANEEKHPSMEEKKEHRPKRSSEKEEPPGGGGGETPASLAEAYENFPEQTQALIDEARSEPSWFQHRSTKDEAEERAGILVTPSLAAEILAHVYRDLRSR